VPLPKLLLLAAPAADASLCSGFFATLAKIVATAPLPVALGCIAFTLVFGLRNIVVAFQAGNAIELRMSKIFVPQVRAAAAGGGDAAGAAADGAFGPILMLLQESDFVSDQDHYNSVFGKGARAEMVICQVLAGALRAALRAATRAANHALTRRPTCWRRRRSSAAQLCGRR